MSLLVQRIFDALANGAIYASLAVALTMVFRASGLLNLAQGEMAMFAAYVVVLLRHDPEEPASAFGGGAPAGSGWVSQLSTPWPIWMAILGAVLFGGLLGALIQRFIIQPLGRRDPLPLLGATVGVFLLLRGLASHWWGSGRRRVDSPFPTESSDFVELFGARLRFATVGTVVILLGALAILALIERRSRIGLAFRALISNPDGAELVGIRVGAVLMTGWAIAAGLGALSGSLVAAQIRIAPNMMARLLVFALAAAILGGLGNTRGAIIGGFAFALLETFLIGYVGFITADIAIVYTLGVLILILIVRPGGLFGASLGAGDRA